MTALALLLSKKLKTSTRSEIERAVKGTGKRSDLSVEEAGLSGELESLNRGFRGRQAAAATKKKPTAKKVYVSLTKKRNSG